MQHLKILLATGEGTERGREGGDRRERQRRRDSADRATQRGNETKETERVVETVWILHVQ